MWLSLDEAMLPMIAPTLTPSGAPIKIVLTSPTTGVSNWRISSLGFVTTHNGPEVP